MHELILIYDFGSQYTQLIARRIRELNVYCEIHPWNSIGEIPENCKGIILSGSPYSVRQPDAPNPNLSQIIGKVPLLGVCYGAQLLAQQHNGEVAASNTREYGRAMLRIVFENVLLKNMSQSSQVWMSHGDSINKLPEGA